MAKNKIINFKVDEDTKQAFEKVCSDNVTTPSHELRLFVHNYIKGKKV